MYGLGQLVENGGVLGGRVAVGERRAEQRGSVGEVDVQQVADGLEIGFERQRRAVAGGYLSGIIEGAENADAIDFGKGLGRCQVGIEKRIGSLLE